MTATNAKAVARGNLWGRFEMTGPGEPSTVRLGVYLYPETGIATLDVWVADPVRSVEVEIEIPLALGEEIAKALRGELPEGHNVRELAFAVQAA